MAVADRPNIQYIVETLKVELEGIQTSKAFYTNVQQVSVPDFSYLDVDRVIGLSETPALMIWVRKIGHGQVLYTLGDKFPEAEIEIIGVVKSRNVQWDMYKLHEDLRRVMLGNPRRIYPGQTNPPDIAQNTREEHMGAEFFVEKAEEAAIGVFASTWYIAYKTRTTEKT